jgi:curved DNA-binding protein CbpA
MNQRTHYEVLGLTPNCTSEDIKKSYRKLALIWHPDKHDNKIEAQANFASINEAYNTLSDTNKREIYDLYGQQGLDMSSSTSSDGMSFFFQKGFNGTEKSPFDLLKDIFAENGDEPVYKEHDMFDFSNNFKSTFESFMNDNFVSATEDDSTNFLSSYKPTFMSETFSSQFMTLDQLYGNQENISKKSNPLNKKVPSKVQKNDKRSFLVNDEEEDLYEDLIFIQRRGTKLDRKLSFYSQAFDEREEEKGNKSRKSGKKEIYNLEGLYQEQGCKKLKTLHSFVKTTSILDDELIC